MVVIIVMMTKIRFKWWTTRRIQSALRTFVWRVDTEAGSTRNRITGGLQIVDQFTQSVAVITQNFQQNNRWAPLTIIWSFFSFEKPKICSVFLVEFDFEIVDVRKVKNPLHTLQQYTFYLKVDTDISHITLKILLKTSSTLLFIWRCTQGIGIGYITLQIL